MKVTLGGQQIEIKKSSIKKKLLNSNGTIMIIAIMITARSILRSKSIIKANKNSKHSNTKPNNSTRINFRTKNFRINFFMHLFVL